MNISSALEYGENLLNKKNDARYLLCCVIKRDLAFLFAHKEYVLTEEEEDLFVKYINERASDKPIQYIIGSCEFMSLRFEVNENVLIPRQDTEILVESVIEKYKGKDVRILDLCTGSGCIAISLAKYLLGSKIVAVDVSKKALDTAVINAKNNGVADRIEFVEMDILEDNLDEFIGCFDVLVSNPPYIPENEYNLLDREVKEYEPRLALYAENEGFEFYNVIVSKWKEVIKKEGLMALEVGLGEAKRLSEIMNNSFTDDINIIKDYAGIDRVVLAVLS